MSEWALGSNCSANGSIFHQVTVLSCGSTGEKNKEHPSLPTPWSGGSCDSFYLGTGETAKFAQIG